MNNYIKQIISETRLPTKDDTIFFETYKFSGNENNEIKRLITSMSYKDFLKTTYWLIISRIVKEKHRYRCSKCDSSSKLNVHHVSYEDHGLEHIKEVRDKCLICLCAHCHRKIHKIKGKTGCVSKKDRAKMALLFKQGKSIPDIAAMMDRNIGTVRRLVNNGLNNTSNSIS